MGKKWFLDLLQKPVKEVDLKTRLSLLDLTFIVLSKDEDEMLEKPLTILLENVPSTSDEYKEEKGGGRVSVAGTSYSTYIGLFQKLCQLLQTSGSKSIFTSLLQVFCR